jgi:ribokinase
VNVCVVGSTMVDLVTRVKRLPAPGETLEGRSLTLGYGGKGGNQAVAAAKLGARVTLVTRIGGDAFGDGAYANYRELGIDLRFVLRDDAAVTGVAPIFVDDEAQNCIVIVPGENGALTPDDVQGARAAIEAADILVCQLEIPIATVMAAFAIARAANVTTLLNPAPAAALPDRLWRVTDIVVPNETEAELLTGIALTGDAEAEAAARVLLARGARGVILTLGGRGSLVIDADTCTRIAPVRVDAVDTTGAGDAYVGTLAMCLAAGRTLVGAARCANLIAALSVTRPGTQTSFPDRETASTFVAGHGLNL